MTTEHHEFQAEVQQLLDLMIHSLYSNRDIFLRELISNASDALDRVRFAGLTEPALLPEGELAIEIRVDPEKRELSISDNGIGMSRDEVVENLGTLARSGTSKFLATLEKSRNAGENSEVSPELIGQFGVGFYASFMVADRVTVLSRKAGEDKATVWESAGDGRFAVADASRDAPGTTVTLHLEESKEGEEGSDYANEWVLRQIVKRYSDFVAYPIQLHMPGAEEEKSAEPLNSMKAIWTRPDEDVSDDERKEFYKHFSHDWNDPLIHVSTRIEGTFEALALLFIPSVAPFDLYHQEMAHRGIQLYVKRVFIMDECRELMPEYLRFVKGVVDAEDLSLNVSREILQQDAQIRVIRNHLVKKVLEALGKLRSDEADAYRGFWEQFGPVLKEGLLSMDEKRERIYELMLCASTHHESQLSSLDEIVERMDEDQEFIYYLTGSSLDVVRRSPQIEAFRDRGIEVVLFTDPVDELWLQRMPPSYRDKEWKFVGEGEVEFGDEEEKKAAEEAREQDASNFRELLTRLRSALQEDVAEVRLSTRLRSSPVCLVREEGELSPHMAELMRQTGREIPDAKPILELNASHSLLVKLNTLCDSDPKDERLEQYAKLLLGQALLAEGGRLTDPTTFSQQVAELMERAL
ncbi:molecular chaperone HtpG [Myxococcota bacterium]|nr:molecular chaperone HtpG [Myxococcota bacterium]